MGLLWFIGLFIVNTLTLFRLAEMAPGWQAGGRYDRFVDQSALLSAVRDVEPGQFREIRERFVDGFFDDLPEEAVVSRFATIAQAVQSRYLPYASDEALLAQLAATLDFLKSFVDANPGLCVLDIAGRADPLAAGQIMSFPSREVATESEADQVLEVLAEQRPEVFDVLGAADLSDLDLLTEDAQQAICRANIDLMDFLLSQPADVAAPVFRLLNGLAAELEDVQ